MLGFIDSGLPGSKAGPSTGWSGAGVGFLLVWAVLYLGRMVSSSVVGLTGSHQGGGSP